MSTYGQSFPSGARQAFDDAMEKLSDAISAHQEAQIALRVLDANITQLENIVKQHTGGGQ